MSDGDRGKRSALVAITLGFIVAALVFVSYAWMFFDMGASRAQYAADRERNAQHNAAYTTQRIENECIRAEGTALQSCISEAVKAGAEYQQSERDLEAQRGMSKWAFWLLIISGGQLAATVIGLIYLKGTLDATWRAVTDTSKATEAMLESNEIARASQRAWLDIEPHIRSHSPGYGVVGLGVSASFKNIGSTLAHDVGTSMRFRIGSGATITEQANDLMQQMMKMGGGLSMMPGKERSAVSRNNYLRKNIEWDDFGRAVFAIIAVVAYRSEGSSRRHYTRCVWRLRTKGSQHGAGAIGLTWDQFRNGELEIDPDNLLMCS